MSAEPDISFGALLRRYHEAAGLSQEDLAERAGSQAAAMGLALIARPAPSRDPEFW
jgi:hypothetical protein